MNFNTISVIGLGYIGLPTAAIFASRKKKVIGVDVNQHAVDTINRGEIHIIEPELDIVVRAAVTEGYLRATTKPEPADAFLIAVPTPFKGDNHEPDLSYVEKACKSIAPVLKKGNLVILESTSPVGTTEKMAQWLADVRPDLRFPLKETGDIDVFVAHCPERVLPGHVMRELIENDRLIGGLSDKCSIAAAELYKVFVRGECLVTTARTAEMAKLTENSFRDVNIAFANELSIICDELKINVWDLIRLANRHPRVNILQPGPGVGGHCIAVDPWFIVSQAPESAKLIRVAREVNDSKPHWVLDKVNSAIARLKEKNTPLKSEKITVACLGLSFKPNIDDIRESPALEIVKELSLNELITIVAVEPNIHSIPGSLSGVSLLSLEDAIDASEIVLLLVDHKEFKQVVSKDLTDKVVIDTKGIWPFVTSN